jgi:hypothetical protein
MARVLEADKGRCTIVSLNGEKQPNVEAARTR